ncbi:MAG: hydrogenase nickel incorporation protein HypB [Tractidigestivibacter sp.]|jgi:hydrogenase nickel incorporation protein HypB|uniref:hydrogenase nickel incorporation protein HypB n=1 Tax=Tractidigestivibacter sp. TaxID=2847320 RepID=UPI003D9435B5
MEEVKVIELKESVFADNDAEAKRVRQQLRSRGQFLVNVMSSPGSGKTTTLTRLINLLKSDYKIGVMEADIDGAVDTEDIVRDTGAKAIQLHTGGMCHLDAGMTKTGLDSLETDGLDLLFLENVGNLVCPAEFDTGASKNCVILSVPEGDDKPLKYPLMFEKADVVVLNKVDVLPYFDFDIDKFKGYLAARNPSCQVIPISAKTGEGVDELAAWVRREASAWREA